jgi:hypothetical protein
MSHISYELNTKTYYHYTSAKNKDTFDAIMIIILRVKYVL